MRLVQGDFARETRYADDPVEMARHWEAEGAQRLHVVDLDGARDGTRANASVISDLLRAVSLPVQVGGGIRTVDTARTLLEQGADRVVIGTAAAENPETLTRWTDAFGDHLVVGIDARDGKVTTHGWLTLTDLDVVSLCETLTRQGVCRVVYTDVGRDGVLGGPNVNTTRALAKLVKVIGSGGVSSVEDLRTLANAGAEGAIIGTALYEGRLTLKDALSVSMPC